MKNISCFKIYLISFLVFSFLPLVTPVHSQIEGKTPEASLRATEGDTVWVLLNHVKPDKKAQFEEFIEQILIPAIEKLATTDSIQVKMNRQSRLLYPIKANEDGSYMYVFLLDPVVSKADYSFARIFNSLYTEKEADQFISMFEDALVVPQIGYGVIQKAPVK
jgi:hypothetical protein